jgi:amino acid adenylation domain-containing protein
MPHTFAEAQPAETLTPPSACDSLAARFRKICGLHADRIAVSLDGDSITYDALNNRAQRTAAALHPQANAPGALIAIYLERSIDLVAAMLGTVQAGHAYLPLDVSYPTARILETLSDAAPAAILTTRPLAARLTGLDLPALFVEDLPEATGPVPNASSPDDLAYVIYTSGSTGKPKGVMVSQQNVLRLFDRTEAWFHFDHRDVWTMFHSFAFDFSVWEMWGPLLTGGRLVLVPYATSRSPEDFYALLADERVTVLNQTPSALSMLVQAEARTTQRPLALRTIILGGEALNLRALSPWFARHGDTTPEIFNMYGITETTVHVTCRRIRASDAERESESLIGEPIPDLQIHLLDDQQQPVRDSDIGEIYIGGPGVALGYLRRPELSAQRFLPNPFGPAHEPGRLYRSGDLARRRPDGELVYLGRADRQVKINGFRIELGELEAALTAFPGILQACVTVHADPTGGQRLAAYFVASAPVDTKELTDFLATRLPAQMRPAFYLPLAALPINANGKIDRDALPSPVEATPAAAPSNLASIPEIVASIWRRILGSSAITEHDNFFDAGGTSVLLIAVRAALQEQLGRTIPITWLFEHTTIAALAAKLSEPAAPPAAASPSIQDNARRQREALARMKTARNGAR